MSRFIPDKYHDGDVQDITFYQLAYCKISGCYYSLTHSIKDYWRHEILRLPRLAPITRSEAAAIIAGLAAQHLSESMAFCRGVRVQDE